MLFLNNLVNSGIQLPHTTNTPTVVKVRMQQSVTHLQLFTLNLYNLNLTYFVAPIHLLMFLFRSKYVNYLRFGSVQVRGSFYGPLLTIFSPPPSLRSSHLSHCFLPSIHPFQCLSVCPSVSLSAYMSLVVMLITKVQNLPTSITQLAKIKLFLIRSCFPLHS